jgi:hypothetical protein
MNYYFEFGGGLGDIFFRIFAEGEYRTIQRLLPGDRARVTLITINPFADELFQWHPKRQQLEITIYPHWRPDEDEGNRSKYNLPPLTSVTKVDPGSESIEFYTSQSDREILYQVRERPYFVMAASAGGDWRIFPENLISMICREAAELKLTIAGIGRSYPEQRGGRRHEPAIPKNEYTIDLIDQLSVPGAAKLVEGSLGVICTHTSICHLAWFLKKSVLLLYPQQVYEEHIAAPRTGYTRGLDWDTTKHSLFANCSAELVREFLHKASQI